MTFKTLTDKAIKLGAASALAVTMVAGMAAPASASTWNDGQAWWNCKNQYTYWSGGVYSGSRYMGSMTVYGCSNGFWVRTASAIGYASVSTSLQRLNPWYGNAASGNYAAITPYLVDKNYGSTYQAHAYINGAVRDLRFTIYY